MGWGQVTPFHLSLLLAVEWTLPCEGTRLSHSTSTLMGENILMGETNKREQDECTPHTSHAALVCALLWHKPVCKQRAKPETDSRKGIFLATGNTLHHDLESLCAKVVTCACSDKGLSSLAQSRTHRSDGQAAKSLMLN